LKKILILAALLVSLPALSQKKPLDHSVFDAWESVSQTAISPSGNVISYAVQPQEGDGNLYFRVMGKNGREIVIPRGYKATILDDDSYAICLIKPEFQKTRRAKIKGKKGDALPKDSLAVINLKTGDIRRFADVQEYKAGKHALKAFAFATTDTTLVPKKERKKKDIGKPLAVYHFADGSIDTLRHIDDFDFSKDGLQLALVRKEGKNKTLPGFYSTATRESFFSTDTVAWTGLPVFDEDGTRALYLQACDTASTGSKHAELYLWDIASKQSKQLTNGGSYAKVPQGWGLTENTTPRWSHDGKRIFAGVQEFVPPKDTNLVSFETPGLDIWNWDSYELPPALKVRQKDQAKRTYLAELLGSELVPFTTRKQDRFYLGNRGDSPVHMIVSIDDPVETQWSYLMKKSIYISGKKVYEGRTTDETLSPEANYAIWWDYEDLKWHICNTADLSVNTVEGNFWDQDNDRPAKPDSYGIAGWTLENQEDALIYDKYDIWRVLPDGSTVRQTWGREKNLTYRYIDTRDKEEERYVPFIAYASVFDNTTKQNGVSAISVFPVKVNRTALIRQDLCANTFSGFKKARNADVLLWQKGNFRDPMDLYYVAPKKAEKLTSINPQISDYNWGTVELYKWNAFDGTQLEGLLYKPEDFDASKKYPVIIYFYEKYSESLYEHYQVQPMWSIINIPFFVSRGYVVFVPDIVYRSGIPGESAYNCIVSGAQSLWQYPWIDKDNMAIQGQSWGGYQVAYLITRTSMFKCAGAGAPVSNMTSAYGGIRWESGNSRQGQYEMGQSRIGRPLWDGIELYMENSPLFKLPNVTTPVLIMHNDNDGAVPWYQGIEMFMGLRRLGKPAWLLEYNDEAHNLRERRNRKDLSIRLQQFFDYYLKGEPEPAWMKDGVPTAKKGYYFGYENAE
jgi:dipeptidyl aminopeptidase/acylaminoacyl peptidase